MIQHVVDDTRDLGETDATIEKRVDGHLVGGVK